MSGRALLLGACLTACAAEAPKEQESRLVETELAVDLELPALFDAALRQSDAVVFAGPSGSDSYYTTMVLQSLPWSPVLSRVLADSYANPDLGRVTWLSLEPASIAGCFGLRYVVAFAAQEQPRLRTGLLLTTETRAVDFSYTAPDNLFAKNLPAFEAAVDSLAVLDAGGLSEL
jgi:hypothetical protein